METTISEWSDPPQMETGDPDPALVATGAGLLLVYRVAAHLCPEEQELFAVVRFRGVRQFKFGSPNGEGLAQHPLFPLGIRYYAFNLVAGSPRPADLSLHGSLSRTGADKHWLVSFHDQTLEVVAREAEVLGRLEATSGTEALAEALKSS